MGAVYTCLNGCSRWGLPPLVNLGEESVCEEAAAVKQYSWDKKKIDVAQYTIENKEGGEEVGRRPGQINGEQFMIKNCQDTSIFLFDHINTVTIDDCKQCKIFVGPTKGSIFLRDSSDCTLVAACGQFRTRDCRKINVFLCCNTQPIIEATTSIKLGCFQYWYPELESQFKCADLSPYNNLWWNVHDFTPLIGESSNWTLLGECYKVHDYMSLPESPELRDIEVSNSKSVVPLTIGKRTRRHHHEDDVSLVLVFSDEKQDERAKLIVERMVARKEKGQPIVELIQTRQIQLDICDVERIFETTQVRKNAANGPLIALQFAGSGSLSQARVVVNSVAKVGGYLYTFESQRETKAVIDNLFKFADMQLGI